MSTPAHKALSVQQFLTKNSMTPLPHPPYSSNLTSSDIFCFVSPDENSPQREMFCQCGRREKKNGRSTKSSKTVLSSEKKVSIGILHQMEITLKVTED